MSEQDTQNLKVETILMDQDENQLAIVAGALWPPKDAVIELSDPNRDAVVQDVRLRLHLQVASVIVRVHDA